MFDKKLFSKNNDEDHRVIQNLDELEDILEEMIDDYREIEIRRKFIRMIKLVKHSKASGKSLIDVLDSINRGLSDIF